MSSHPIVSDASIKWRIEQELLGDPRTMSNTVGIGVFAGAVTLSGQLDSLAAKQLVTSVAFRVPGITAIADAITVAVPDGHLDIDIAEHASQALRASVDVPEDAIQIVVDQGAVTLSGSVAWDFQRDAARQCVAHIAGVRVVHDEIVLAHRVPNADALQELQSAFARSARLRDRHLQVLYNDGIVTLRGTVESCLDRHEAIRTAWSAPGTRQVVCLLEVVYDRQDALMA